MNRYFIAWFIQQRNRKRREAGVETPPEPVPQAIRDMYKGNRDDDSTNS